jgi:NhaP-type Na+/H+ or K+/H+ antiporter
MGINASSAALTLSGAAVAGIVSQSIARSLNVPGIVLLLAVGVLLGPDVAGIIQPTTLGTAMPEVVGFAVAVILFEGGMHLNLSRFGKQEKPIRRLVTYGALITAVGSTLAAKLFMGWDWRFSILFGSLVIVTGPTVVTPLVRRFKLVSAVGDILEAEGVLIDAIGAVIAVVALEVALEPSGASLAKGAVGIAVRLGLGALVGLVAGSVVALLLRSRNLIAEGLANVFTLAMVWAIFKVSEALVHESGVAAVTVAGLVLGNLKSHRHDRLVEFNDQLTVLLIGMLFVLLAADVRVHHVTSLGWPGLWTVGALVVVVRPMNVALSTVGADLPLKQRAFIAWIGPRGIIAAAVASLFANSLAARNIDGGAELKALVFLVIAVTVVLAGLTGGPLAKALGLSRPPTGWLFLGANALAVAVAKILVERGEEVTLLDRSVDHCQRATSLGIPVVTGNGLDEETLLRLHIERRAGVVAVTPSDEVNLLFIQKSRAAGKVKTLFAALKSATLGASAKDVRQAGGAVLFGDEYEVDRWMTLLRDGDAEVRMLTAGSATNLSHGGKGGRLAIPLVLERGSTVRPIASDIAIKNGDLVHFAVDLTHEEQSMTWLHLQGWQSE